MKHLKALNLLKKIKQAKIDEITPIITQLAQQYHEISTKIDNLLKQAEQEKLQISDSDPANNHTAFGQYYSGILAKITLLKQELLTIEEKLDIVRAELQEHYSEAKRYEIAASNLEEQIKTESERKLMAMLDDIAQRKVHRT